MQWYHVGCSGVRWYGAFYAAKDDVQAMSIGKTYVRAAAADIPIESRELIKVRRLDYYDQFFGKLVRELWLRRDPAVEYDAADADAAARATAPEPAAEPSADRPIATEPEPEADGSLHRPIDTAPEPAAEPSLYRQTTFAPAPADEPSLDRQTASAPAEQSAEPLLHRSTASAHERPAEPSLDRPTAPALERSAAPSAYRPTMSAPERAAEQSLYRATASAPARSAELNRSTAFATEHSVPSAIGDNAEKYYGPTVPNHTCAPAQPSAPSATILDVDGSSDEDWQDAQDRSAFESQPSKHRRQW